MIAAWRSPGRAVALVGALVAIASGALVWGESSILGAQNASARGYETAIGLGSMLVGLIALMILLLAKESRVRNGAAGAAFLVITFAAGWWWFLLADLARSLSVTAMGLTHGTGPLVALLGGVLGLTGVAWETLWSGARVQAPELPDDARWR